MLKRNNTINNTIIYQPHLLLDFTSSFENDVPKDDISRTIIQIVERINVGKYIDLTNRNTFGYDGVMLLKLVLLAFSEKGYASTRYLSDKCLFDIRYKFIAQEAQPSHMVFWRFLNNDLKMGIKDIFYEINQIMADDLQLDTTVLLIDGSKFEANANKNTFIWRKNTERYYKSNWKKAIKALKRLNHYFEASNLNLRVSILKKPTIAYLIEVCEQLERVIEDKGITFVKGKGKKKSQEQKYYEEIKEIALKLWEYTIQYDLLDGRNSCSKTGPDANFMHMKYDYYNHTNVFKPGYNVQIGISGEGMIRDVYVSSDCNDIKTYRPFLEAYNKNYGSYPQEVVADAGYGSYENYYYSELKNIEAYITYSGYYREKNRSKKYNYRSYNSLCTKSKTGRGITRCNQLERYHNEVKERVESDEGKALLKLRRVFSEGVFGIIKEDYKYDRIRRRGKTGVESEIILVCIGFNLRKYNKELAERRKLVVN